MTNRLAWSTLLTACSQVTLPGSPQPADVDVPPIEDVPDGPIGGPSTARGTVPLYGGTMASDPHRVVIADPSTDEVVIASTVDSDIIVSVSLEEHSEPFRIALADETAYVSLRGSGDVAAIRLTDGEVLATAPACAEPRGVDAGFGGVFVACASGRVVEYDEALQVRRSTIVEPDLRDVVVTEEHLWLSTFRSARAIALDRVSLAREARLVPSFEGTDQPHQAPAVAWRMRAHPDGGVLVMHLGATTEAISLDPVEEDPRDPIDPDGGDNPYGGNACEPAAARTSTHFTHFTSDFRVRTGGALLGAGPRYDFALDDRQLFVPNAGASSSDAAFGPITGGTTHLPLDLATDAGHCLFDVPIGPTGFEELATSITVVHGFPWLFAREPSRLWDGSVVRTLGETDPATAEAFTVFHTAQSTGMACATCHPEGQDDGHVWVFEDLGPRRTQNIAGGVGSRAPFHWDGEFESLDDLMHDVFVGRMGGEELPPESTDDLADWMDDLPPLRSEVQEPGLVEQGRKLFESAAVGCTACHVGDQLTDSNLHVVRAGDDAFKTPSLLGVGGRTPLMHDGCAQTLEERFTNPECGGGDLHGRTSQLTMLEVQAMTAYLRTL